MVRVTNDGSLLRGVVKTLRSRDVLKTQVLPTIASNRTLQRVVTKYELMLREIDARELEE